MTRTLLPLLWGAACGLQAQTPTLLPDGSPFEEWRDTTTYTRSWHVAQQHPAASDDNPGTPEHPLRTIDRAAGLVKPGERVVIHSGVYRELVQPVRGGEGPARMIAYEAAPGDTVVLKGSRILNGPWERSRAPRAEGAAPFSKKLWMTAVQDAAFRTPNATDAEMDLMPWATSWKGRIPYTLRRALLFDSGRRMVQLAAYEDVARIPGSYWVAPDGGSVHVHLFDGGVPAGRLIEAAVQNHLIRASSPGLGYIRISGLTLEHCANGFLRVGVGALFTNGGHHWIIEGNTVRHVNSVGIEMGYVTHEQGDPAAPRRTGRDLGRAIVRQNRILDCGTAGIRAHTVSHALVEGNVISDIGWQDAEYHWETAGIKLLINNGTLVRANRISRTTGAGGIWLDWDNRNSRVTGNVIEDVSTVQGAIFVEASQHPNVVDHNVVRNVDGQGVRLGDTDLAIVENNTFVDVSESVVIAVVATDRSLNGRRLTARGNRVRNNLFIRVKPVDFRDKDNVAEGNTVVD